jgi:Molybdopterin-binding domain of aldehyde dehydrogenase
VKDSDWTNGVGRVVNPRMARSQAIGGMVGGIGMALMEHTITDRQSGRIVNADLANYLVPVNADIADLDAIFVEEDDPYVNPLGVKGVSELARWVSHRPSRTRCSTRPVSACVTCPSRLRNCSDSLATQKGLSQTIRLRCAARLNF